MTKELNKKEFSKKLDSPPPISEVGKISKEEKDTLLKENGLGIANLENKIENVLEIKVGRDEMESLNRMLKEAELLNKLENNEELDQEGWYKLGKYFERHFAPMTVYDSLSEGDKIIRLLTPGGELSVKNLNKNFGESVTNKIIAQRRNLVENLADKYDLKLLSQDYKSSLLSGQKEEKIKEFIDEVKKQLDEFILNLMDEIKDSSGTSEDKKKSVDNVLKILREFGFNFSPSVVEVKDFDKNNKYISSALAIAVSSAKANSFRGRSEYSLDSNYDNELVYGESLGIKETGKFLKDKELVDDKGRRFKIIDKDGDLDLNLLIEVRKGKFKPLEEKDNLDNYKKFDILFRQLNVFDNFKINTFEEISGEQKMTSGEGFDKYIQRITSLSKGIKEKKLTSEQKKEIADFLRRDYKDQLRTSEVEFHNQAVKKDKAVYISLDVKGLGARQLQEYFNLAKDVSADKINVEEALLKAGDKITKEMRNVREQVSKVYEKYFTNSKDQLIMKVGGDEVTIVTDFLEEKEMDNFLIDLQKATESRVVKTFVAKAQKDVSTMDNYEKKKEEHLKAIKRAETGIVISKEIEQIKSEIESYLKNDRTDKIGEIKNNYNTLGVDYFCVKEAEKESFVIVNKNGDYFLPEELKDKLEKILIICRNH